MRDSGKTISSTALGKNLIRWITRTMKGRLAMARNMDTEHKNGLRQKEVCLCRFFRISMSWTHSKTGAHTVAVGLPTRCRDKANYLWWNKVGWVTHMRANSWTIKKMVLVFLLMATGNSIRGISKKISVTELAHFKLMKGIIMLASGKMVRCMALESWWPWIMVPKKENGLKDRLLGKQTE